MATKVRIHGEDMGKSRGPALSAVTETRVLLPGLYLVVVKQVAQPLRVCSTSV